ncbi:aldo/keto reductase [Sulfurimonas sp.]|uniref:aldo/keto reductase n=1 Tax=Sulfurimonas sp. TaxID=2022749 RepID=UPI0035699C59
MKTLNWNNHTISKLCLGTVQFGLNYGIANKDGEVSQQEVNTILKYVLSKDINCLDTGSMYGNSEEKIGNYLKGNDLDTMIISKIKSDFFQVEHELSIQNIEKSLKYLSSNTLFALLLHNIEAIQNWSLKDTELICELKKQNKIKYFGVSIYTNDEFNLALKNDNVDIIQIPFNLLDQRAIKNNWLKKAKEKNKLVFIRSVYLQGLILMDKYSIPTHLDSAKQSLNIIDETARKLNITKNELALSFVNQMAKNSILLFGCDSLKQAAENINNYNNLPKLDSQTIEYLTNSLSNIDEYIYNPSKWSK